LQDTTEEGRHEMVEVKEQQSKSQGSNLMFVWTGRPHLGTSVDYWALIAKWSEVHHPACSNANPNHNTNPNPNPNPAAYPN